MAVFDAGCGTQGDYDFCSWQVLGTGQFRPLPGSDPFLGELGQVEHVPEWRVETLCPEEHIARAIAALRAAHPYEEPAFEVHRIMMPHEAEREFS